MLRELAGAKVAVASALQPGAAKLATGILSVTSATMEALVAAS